MGELVKSGTIVDLILLLVAVEFVLLFLLVRFTGRGPSVFVLLPNLLAGAFLLLALRAALQQADWTWVAAWLAAAGAAHLADLWSRWKR